MRAVSSLTYFNGYDVRKNNEFKSITMETRLAAGRANQCSSIVSELVLSCLASILGAAGQLVFLEDEWLND